MISLVHTLAALTLHGTVVVANMNDNTATIIDLASRRTIATLPTGDGPHEVAISHSGRWAVVSNYGPAKIPGHSLTVIDLAARVPVVVRTIELGADNGRPHGSAFLPGDTTLLVTVEKSQSVLVVDISRGVVEASIPTHGRATHMIALTAAADRAYTSNVRDGTISELDITRRAFVRTIPVAPMVEGIAVTPDGSQVWVGSDSVKTVSIVPKGSEAAANTVTGFGFPYRIAITSNNRTAVVTDPARGELRFLDVATRSEIGRTTFPAVNVVSTSEFPGSPCPEGMVLAPDGETVYVTMQGLNAIAVVDVTTHAVLLTLPTGVWPDGIAYTPAKHVR
jgi:YVTN family beta-propeller protein